MRNRAKIEDPSPATMETRRTPSGIEFQERCTSDNACQCNVVQYLEKLPSHTSSKYCSSTLSNIAYMSVQEELEQRIQCPDLVADVPDVHL